MEKVSGSIQFKSEYDHLFNEKENINDEISFKSREIANLKRNKYKLQ